MRKTIGIDITPLQGPHRMRGVGFVLKHFLENLPKDNDAIFLFYYNAKGDIGINEVIDSLSLDNLTYSLQEQKSTESHIPTYIHFPAKMRIVLKIISAAERSLRLGYRIPKLKMHSFIQFDPTIPFPRLNPKTIGVLFVHDIIPYVLESDYLWGYKVARRRGLSRKGAVMCLLRRLAYLVGLQRHCGRADVVLANSETTRDDFIKQIKIPAKKIRVVPLGVEKPNKDGDNQKLQYITHYKSTSWGYFSFPYSTKNLENYILFVGGIDARRRLEDVVLAFNYLRDSGHELKLVLSGDCLQGPENVPNPVLRFLLLSSPFQDDIIYAGFTDTKTRNYLYNNALAFVFPSVYEGFGLPVLEALGYGSPVVAYPNRATVEVAKDRPLYARDTREIIWAIQQLLNMGEKSKRSMQKRNKLQANKYPWSRTAKLILDVLESSKKGLC